MREKTSPGKRFKIAVSKEKPLQVVGVINAYCARMAQHTGYKALYLSGASVANASLGLPELAPTSLNDVLEDARRITDVTDLPLLVDVDTGWGSTLNVARTIRQMIKADVAAVHIEDQFFNKRGGHRLGKQLISPTDMTDRIKAAVDARTDKNFVVMAGTDAFQPGGLHAAMERAAMYIEAGADMLFVETVTDLQQYKKITQKFHVPVLANITEFTATPLFTIEQLRSVGISMALYPLSAFRAMNYAAQNVYKTLRKEGTQASLVDKMQTREELDKNLDYDAYEKQLTNKK